MNSTSLVISAEHAAIVRTAEILAIARKHLGGDALMESSARRCMEDADNAYAVGRLTIARARAIRSLMYSVGAFHADYARAAALP